MSQLWYSLYLPTNQTALVADTLRTLLAARDYQPYDPFPGGTGTPPGLKRMIRQFVAPPQGGWTRVLGQPLDAVLAALSEHTDSPVLYAWLTDDDGGFVLFRNGERHDDPAMLDAYLKPETSPDHLRRAFAGDLPVPVLKTDQPPVAVIGGDALPPDVQQLARDKGVDAGQANKLIERLSGGLFGKLGGSSQDQQQARDIVMGGGRDRWNSLDGQRVRAIASVLTLPENWRAPDWQTVRDAYHVHRLRERNPRAPLLPGDKDALKAVPDALSYLPVYMGQP
ncbi:MAG: hypothetical protein JXJ20_04340 [Anaerolineae bacterium]|nr:hypothetical protein [Anaerolineae bacterium]